MNIYINGFFDFSLEIEILLFPPKCHSVQQTRYTEEFPTCSQIGINSNATLCPNPDLSKSCNTFAESITYISLFD